MADYTVQVKVMTKKDREYRGRYNVFLFENDYIVNTKAEVMRLIKKELGRATFTVEYVEDQ